MKSKNKNWSLIRTILFIVLGLLNTLLIRPEDIGTWKNYLGYAFLLIGIVDAFFLFRKYLKVRKSDK